MILITTSRKPCNRTRSFCKDLQRALPEAIYRTRGKAPLDEVLGEEKVIYITDRKGNPGKMEIYREGKRLLSLVLKGVRLRREIQSPLPTSEGELADAISKALNLGKEIVKQHGDAVAFNKGPEIKVISYRGVEN
jgi:U3 small nucleolar ribonucleoprotein protein IMP4